MFQQVGLVAFHEFLSLKIFFCEKCKSGRGAYKKDVLKYYFVITVIYWYALQTKNYQYRCRTVYSQQRSTMNRFLFYYSHKHSWNCKIELTIILKFNYSVSFIFSTTLIYKNECNEYEYNVDIKFIHTYIIGDYNPAVMITS